MDLGSNKDGGTTETVWTSSSIHPRPVHRLDQSDSGVFDLLEFLIPEFKLTTKSVNVNAGIYHGDVFPFQPNLLAEYSESFGNFEHVLLDGICEIDQKQWTLFDPTHHVKTGSRDNFRVPTLQQIFVR